MELISYALLFSFQRANRVKCRSHRACNSIIKCLSLQKPDSKLLLEFFRASWREHKPSQLPAWMASSFLGSHKRTTSERNSEAVSARWFYCSAQKMCPSPNGSQVPGLFAGLCIYMNLTGQCAGSKDPGQPQILSDLKDLFPCNFQSIKPLPLHPETFVNSTAFLLTSSARHM